MKILFALREMKMEQLGIMYLSAALKKYGHETFLTREDIPEYNLKNQINKVQPHYVCYSVYSGSEDYYFNLDAQIRKEYPSLHFVSIYGGPAVTFNPEKFKNKVFMRGEGEVILPNFINGTAFEELKLVDVNQIEPPDRALVYSYQDLLNNPIKNMITSRGCYFNCSYCFNHKWNLLHKNQNNNQIIRKRLVEHVIQEAIDIKTFWQPVKMIHIMDDNFVTSIDWLKKFAMLWKSEVNLPFICNVTPKNLTLNAAKLLAEAGCNIITLSIEAANNENRTKILHRVCNKDHVIEALKNCKLCGIRTRLNNIIGLPVENSLKDAYETLDFNIKCKPTSSWCAILQCYPGTQIYNLAKKNGYIHESDKVDEGFFGISTLKIKDKILIERLHKWWPLITAYPFPFRFLTFLLIRLPLSFKIYQYIFKITKKYLSERDLWRVF